jgi:hypothetical protein
MRRSAVFALPIFALCSLAVGASATSPWDIELKGQVEKGGRAEISIRPGRVSGTPVHRYRWEFRDLSVRCSGERQTAKLPVTGGRAANAEFDQVGDHWGISGTGGAGVAATYGTRVSGRLVTRKKARGWVRVFGTAVAIRGGGRESCDSGRLRWVARAGD